MSNEFSYKLEQDYYSRHRPRKDLSYLDWEPYLSCWLDAHRVFKPKRVLDIGAGECVYSKLIVRWFSASEVVACELFHERMLPAFQSNLHPTLYFVAGDCFRLPFKSQSFDVVFGSFILYHLPELEKIIPEVRRVMKKGGCYIGIEPNPWNPVVLYRQMLRLHASPNQYLLNQGHLAIFKSMGFVFNLTYFNAKLPRLRNRLLSTCMGIEAKLRDNKDLIV